MKLVANQPFDMEYFFSTASLYWFFEYGEVLTATSTSFVVRYSEPGFSETLSFSGSFSGYSNGVPTSGTITAASYSVNGTTMVTLTQVSMSVQAFTGYAEADDFYGMFQALMSGDDEVVGSAGDDLLYGFNGNDTLNGGAGADWLYGGLGNDTYVLNSTTDVVGEDVGAGTDTIQTNLTTYTLGQNLENLTYTGIGNFSGFGNGLANEIRGSSGNDTIQGWAGADKLYGFGGNDTFYVDNVGDVVIDTDGNDTIISSVTYTLTDISADNLTLTSSASLNATGNVFANILTGNAGANSFWGMGGNDTIYGNAGVDTVHAGDGNDTVYGGTEGDTLYGEGDSDHLYGGDANDNIDGGDGNDHLYGQDGNDQLWSFQDGAGTYDELDGGNGADSYKVNDGDTVLEFAANDLTLDFYTTNPLSRLAVSLDSAGVTEIRAYAPDSSYQQILISNGISPMQLGVSFHSDDVGAIIRFTRQDQQDELFKFAFDQTHALTTATDRWKQFFDQAGREAFSSVLINEGMSDVENIIQAVSGMAAGDAAKLVAEKFLKDVGIVVDAYEFTIGLQKIVQTWLKGGYDGKEYQAAQDLGVALSGLLLPDGADTLFKIGTDFAALLIGDVVLQLHSSTAEFYDQIKNGTANVATDDTNIIVTRGDQTQIYSKGGNDLVIYNNPPADGAMNAQTMADPVPQTIDGGEGEDTIAYSVGTSVRVDLSKGTATGTEIGTDKLVSIEHAVGGSAADVLIGNALANKLTGNDGNDLLQGGEGADELDGGEGTDIYQFMTAADHAAAEINDGGLAGADEVRFSATSEGTLKLFADDKGIERIVIGTGTNPTAALSGTVALNVDARLLGNAVTMVGNSGANILQATAFADTLQGGVGTDRLYGYAGNDTLDGGRDADAIYGGTGDDTYIVDNSSDALVEVAGEGVDTAMASVAYTLRANVENLVQTGVLSISGSGNALDNSMTGNAGANKLYGLAGNDTIVGNAGNDTLDGGAGVDTLIGGVGNDIYGVDDAGDSVTELAGEGADRVDSSISYTLGANLENLTLSGSGAIDGTGNDLANVIKGNAGGNVLSGHDGNDKLYGGAGDDQVRGGHGVDWLEGGVGRDELFGGAGADRFVFRTGDLGGPALASLDVIQDFVRAEGDKIRLDLIDANTTLAGTQDFTFIGTGAFTGVAGQLRYETSGGNSVLWADTNGDGAADVGLQLTGVTSLVAGDFIF